MEDLLRLADDGCPHADVVADLPEPNWPELPAATTGRSYVQPGRVVLVELPYSEVCMHMRVAGYLALAELTAGRYPAVQLWTCNGRPFSMPILPGEAGFYNDGSGWYVYPPTGDQLRHTTCLLLADRHH